MNCRSYGWLAAFGETYVRADAMRGWNGFVSDRFLSNINGLCQIARNVTTGQIAIFQLRGDHNIGAIGQGTSN